MVNSIGLMASGEELRGDCQPNKFILKIKNRIRGMFVTKVESMKVRQEKVLLVRNARRASGHNYRLKI
jgi:hypothetical protein